MAPLIIIVSSIGILIAFLEGKKVLMTLLMVSSIAGTAGIALNEHIQGNRLEEKLDAIIKNTEKRLEGDEDNEVDEDHLRASLKALNDAKAKEQEELLKKWTGAKKMDSGYKRLEGASGRYSGVWFQPIVVKNGDAVSVVVHYRAYCKSNNFLIGSKVTGRLRIGGVSLGSVSSDCGPRGDTDKSEVKRVLLTDEQIRAFGPSDLKMSNDYK